MGAGWDGTQKCMAALAFNGGNILLPKPGFPLYQALAEFHGLEPRFYQLLEDRGWEADLHHLTSLADHNTAAVLVCNPGNPTGQNYTCAQQALLMSAEQRHCSLATQYRSAEPTLYTLPPGSSLGLAYSATGGQPFTNTPARLSRTVPRRPVSDERWEDGFGVVGMGVLMG